MARGILRAIVPSGKLYESARMQMAIHGALDKVGQGMLRTYQEIVSNWKTKVVFAVKVTVNGSQAMVEVWTENEIYGYVTEGTKPHIIVPRRARMLRFQTGYRAKTSPRSIKSGAGGAFGDVAFAHLVHHPGTQARHFERNVMKRYQDVIPAVVQAAITEALKGG